MRTLYEIDCPQHAVLCLGETEQPHLLRLTVKTAHAEPMAVLLDRRAFQELSALNYRFHLQDPEPANDGPVLSLAAAS